MTNQSEFRVRGPPIGLNSRRVTACLKEFIFNWLPRWLPMSKKKFSHDWKSRKNQAAMPFSMTLQLTLSGVAGHSGTSG
ncbi:hypothetical protein L0128_03355 [candidate division KSB1 bacterium]|nr:hypothetical protein [candidate division KSB1 bacterium]